MHAVIRTRTLPYARADTYKTHTHAHVLGVDEGVDFGELVQPVLLVLVALEVLLRLGLRVTRGVRHSQAATAHKRTRPRNKSYVQT
jgi:hypothetical protein